MLVGSRQDLESINCEVQAFQLKARSTHNKLAAQDGKEVDITNMSDHDIVENFVLFPVKNGKSNPSGYPTSQFSVVRDRIQGDCFMDSPSDIFPETNWSTILSKYKVQELKFDSSWLDDEDV